MVNEFSFNKQLAMSHGNSSSSDVKDILLNEIPGALNVIPAHEFNDRQGTDYWIEHKRGRFLSVDVKVREKDFGKDDLALETWSIVDKSVGWTRNEEKQTDYILWFWKDTRRWCLVPFHLLCKVFQEKWEKWLNDYPCYRQFTKNNNGGYYSECVFVPRREVWAQIYHHASGFL